MIPSLPALTSGQAGESSHLILKKVLPQVDLLGSLLLLFSSLFLPSGATSTAEQSLTWCCCYCQTCLEMLLQVLLWPTEVATSAVSGRTRCCCQEDLQQGCCLRQLLLQLMELEPVGLHLSFLSNFRPCLFLLWSDDVLLQIAAIAQFSCLCCTGTWMWKGKVVLSSPLWCSGTHTCAYIFQYINSFLFSFFMFIYCSFMSFLSIYP